MGSNFSKQNNNNDSSKQNNNNNNDSSKDLTKIEFEYKVPKVPMDEEGYVQAFEPEQKEEILQFYNDFGFVVVNNILSEEEIEATIEDIWKEIQTVASEVKREDPSSWWSWPVLATGISATGIYKTKQAWKNRQAERLYQVYNYLYPEEEGRLLASIDRFGIMRPTKDIELDGKVSDQPRWRGPDAWFHWDINPWLYSGVESLQEGDKKADEDWERSPERSFIAENNANLLCEYEKFQSIVALENSNEKNGGFQCVPGFHKQLKEWSSLFPVTSRASFVPFPKELHIEEYAVKITMRKGSVVIWSSRLPHCNYPNATADQWRFCQYIKLFPSRVVENAEGRRNALRTYYMTLSDNEISETGKVLFGF